MRPLRRGPRRSGLRRDELERVLSVPDGDKERCWLGRVRVRVYGGGVRGPCHVWLLTVPCGNVEWRWSLLLCAVRAGHLRDDIVGELPLQLFALRSRKVLYARGRHIADDVLDVPSRHVV